MASHAGWLGLLAPYAYYQIKEDMDVILSKLSHSWGTADYIWSSPYTWPTPDRNPRIDLCRVMASPDNRHVLYEQLRLLQDRSLSIADFNDILLYVSSRVRS